jgi:hypothetical protein
VSCSWRCSDSPIRPRSPWTTSASPASATGWSELKGHERRFLAALWPPAWSSQEDEITARADELLARFRLDHMREEHAGTLSGGQRKLLELARALDTPVLRDASHLLADIRHEARLRRPDVRRKNRRSDSWSGGSHFR